VGTGESPNVHSHSGVHAELSAIIAKWAFDFPIEAKAWNEAMGGCYSERGLWTEKQTMKLKFIMPSNLYHRIHAWYKAQEQRDCESWLDDDSVINPFLEITGGAAKPKGI
jgi:hypothetical protein